MVKVIPLRYGTMFKKVFGEREVFNRFASDVLGVPIEVERVYQEYRYPEPVGKVKIEYDLFGEDVAHRTIVEVQHIRETDFFDRFLHYHLVSLVEQVEHHEHYRIERDVFTLVVLTTEPRDHKLRFSVAVSDMDPVSERGVRLGVYRHRLVFLNPTVINELTPTKARPWLTLIADSLDGEVDESRYDDPMLQHVIRASVSNTVSPDELARIKDEAAWEYTKADARAEGRAEGERVGRAEGARVEGLRLLASACERKLKRALAEDEQAVLARRYDADGADVVGDAVAEMDAAALTGWLAAR